MIAGPGVCICNECIELCQEVLNGDSQRASEPRAKRETVSDTIPMPKPQDIKRVLDEYVIGQDRAKRALCVAIYNHYKRIFLKDDDDNVELTKSNGKYPAAPDSGGRLGHRACPDRHHLH